MANKSHKTMELDFFVKAVVSIQDESTLLTNDNEVNSDGGRTKSVGPFAPVNASVLQLSSADFQDLLASLKPGP